MSVDEQLVLAADQFAITTGGRPTAVAGYPWFGEWSRDLMTSYEGLYLSTGRADEGREVLRTSAATVSEGMLANTADTGSLEYNTVDGTLWFVHAVGRHVSVTGDDDLGHELAPVLDAIVQHHLDGTRYGIGVDTADGLLAPGRRGLGAHVDGRARRRAADHASAPASRSRSTRSGSRALAVAEALGRRPDGDRPRARRRSASFVQRFVRPDGRGLFDVVDGPGGDDASVRPNQLLAVSLPGGPLPLDAARSAVVVCRDELLTPLGLRSLSPRDPAYHPYHRGSPPERDAAYHQGTVWPWLLGPYVDAARVRPASRTSDALAGMEGHLGEWGLGSVSETADGAAPHLATGCPFQAWSVAEVLRVRQEPAAVPQPPARSRAAAPR